MVFNVRKAIWQDRPVSILGEFEPDEEKAKEKGVRYKRWSQVAKYWFANATVTRPHLPFVLKPFQTAKKIRELMQKAERQPKEVNYELRKMSGRITRECIDTVRKTFDEPKARIIFEENGTSALALLRHMLADDGDLIFTTKDTGRLVADALRGADFTRRKENFKQPIALFSPEEPIKEASSRVKQIEIFQGTGGDELKGNPTILREIIKKIRKEQPKIVIVPHVTRTGRILPVKEIGEAIREYEKQSGRKIFFIVDGVQGIGRLPHSEVTNPLKYADAYVITGAKALGAAMQAVIITKKRVTKHAERLAHSGFSSRLRFGQFHPEPPSITKHLNSRDRHYLVSLPEIQSLTLALQDYLRRRRKGGEIDVFAQTYAERYELLKALKKTRLKVLEPTSDAPTVPSIITFKPKPRHPVSPKVKGRLQEETPPITMPSIIADDQRNPFLRIALSELTPRKPNELRHLANAIRKALKRR